MTASINQGRRRITQQVLGACLLLTCAALAWVWLNKVSPDAARAHAKKQGLPAFGFEIVKTYPHDTSAYTQGLLFHDGQLYESTGQYGQSTLRRVEIATGKVQQQIDLDKDYFGEGLSQVDDELFLLTWKERTAFVYDRATFKQKRTHRYEGEGWGLAYDGTHLILSDGTPSIRFLDPKTFRVQRRVTVRLEKEQLHDLNELEYVDGEIWANIWQQDWIARIDPKTGDVVSWIDLSTLWPKNQRRPEDTPLNGIAYDSATKRLWVTGKRWPKIYEVRIIAKKAE